LIDLILLFLIAVDPEFDELEAVALYGAVFVLLAYHLIDVLLLFLFIE
jgi:hypothetical protein